MSASAVVHKFCSVASCFPNCRHNRSLLLTHHQFHSPNSILKLKTQPFHSITHFKSSRTQKPRSSFVVFAAQSNFLKVLQNAWKVSRDGIEAGTNLVPNSVPRPIARISVTIVALSVTLFVLKAFLSTAFFILATIGLAYFAYLAFNKDQGPSGNGGTTSTPMDDPVEEARKIMEKYK
ncbi:SNF2 superfamily protein [Spatholobus suberectus]|nr:SNF2 superfamily protein [Spatholobus suberectus]